MLKEVGPTLKELGILTPEEMGYDKPELAVEDVYDMQIQLQVYEMLTFWILRWIRFLYNLFIAAQSGDQRTLCCASVYMFNTGCFLFSGNAAISDVYK